MKRILIFCSLLIIGMGIVNAQDVITKRSGEDINAKILEVSQAEIKYKKFDNQTGPTFTIAVSEIFMVKYENGTKDVFDKVPQQNQPAQQSQPYYAGNANNYRPTPAGVVPGMSYKHYKGFYKRQRYTPLPGDQYNPTVSGVCSFLIPGLGQMICGEVGRGLGILGSVVGCSILTGVGSNMMLEEEGGAGSALMIAGAVGSLSICIWNIFDAAKVAKVKNMYDQDMRKMATSSIDLKLSPYVETVSLGGQQITPVGFRLCMSF